MTMQLLDSSATGRYDHVATSRPTSRHGHYVATKEDVLGKFYRNLRRWRFDTMYASSVEKIINHPGFREIVEMGEPAIPLIMSEIRARPDMLMIALQLITGADPIQPRNRGKMAAMASDWRDWYRRKG